MSIPSKFLSKILRGWRAHAQNMSGARQHDDKEKIYHKILLLRPKATIVIFSHLLFFVAICCRNKKMLPKYCPTIKERFLFKKVFSKSISNVSKYEKVTLVTGGGNSGMSYVFASYTLIVKMNIPPKVLIGCTYRNHVLSPK